ncbi:equilibrative nucleoside transporter 2 isoform X3 [Dermochelys coriacea]|uniref:equilibrative nucleoside transporter 2 isoform X3 n=1 Tax=Dermochelys coriacea TaxID=27794 RepID=UPI001CA9BD89|nr:equilibrative nucleoside transporter 2 isoform X3 [Dermochelys coriacea]
MGVLDAPLYQDSCSHTRGAAGNQPGLSTVPSLPARHGDIPGSTQMARQDEPKDQFHAVGIIIFILGLGTLLPWNFFITAIPYFQARLIVGTSSSVGPGGNSSVTQPDPAQDDFNFNNWLTLLSQLPLLLFTLLNSFLYQCIPDKVRVLGSMSGILLLFILTAVLVRVEMPPHSFFSITIGSVWFINSFCAVLQGSLFGQLGTLPQGYSTLFLSGQGMAGTFAASAMLLSMASGVDAQTSALSYFITPCVGTLISIVCYLMLPRMAFFRHYMERSWQRDPRNELETKAGLLGPEEQSGDQSERPGNEPQGPEKPMLGMVNGTHRTLEEISVESSGKGAFALHNGTATNSQNRGPVPERPSVFGVLRKIWLLALCIVMVFTVTLSMFPAITATVTSTSESRQWSEFFTPICCFLLFNVMDWLGRSVTSYCRWAGAAAGERAGRSHHDLLPGTRAVVWGGALFPPQGPAVSLLQIHPLIFLQHPPSPAARLSAPHQTGGLGIGGTGGLCIGGGLVPLDFPLSFHGHHLCRVGVKISILSRPVPQSPVTRQIPHQGLPLSPILLPTTIP